MERITLRTKKILTQWKINVNRKLVRVCYYIIYTFYICVLCNKLTSFHVNSLYFAFKII